jgi:hypothetical protein
MTPYKFDNKNCDAQSLVHLINLTLGKDVVGAEVGIERAESFCTLLNQCPNIKVLYGIDKWLPYKDYFNEPYGVPAYEIDEKEADFIKIVALHNIKFSGNKEKAVIIENDSSDAVKIFEDESLDFVFLDTYLTIDQAKKDLEEWYPKVRKGGIFSGHDWTFTPLQQIVEDFRREKNTKSTLSVFDNVWVWFKD